MIGGTAAPDPATRALVTQNPEHRIVSGPPDAVSTSASCGATCLVAVALGPSVIHAVMASAPGFQTVSRDSTVSAK